MTATMSTARSPSPAQLRAVLRQRLQARRAEIEEATLTRVHAISDPAEVADPTYAEGLRTTVTAALDYALEAIERGVERAPPLPPALLTQARAAARNGVGLHTVLRRYFAGYTLLGDFLTSDVAKGVLPPGVAPTQLLQGWAALFDRLIAAVSEEYERETASRMRSSEQRRAERVQRLLDGESLDTSELRYDLSCWHLGVVAAGDGSARALRDLSDELDCRLLLVQPERDVAWAWLGARRRLDPADLDLEGAPLSAMVALAIGEPSRELAGWRLTHRQAVAALPVAIRGRTRVRYGDVCVLASILRDDLLATSLRRLYLDPLASERDGGELLRKTLRAYFASGRNLSSAAPALGVNRHTVARRLRTVEEKLNLPLSVRAADLEVALRLDELDRLPVSPEDSLSC